MLIEIEVNIKIVQQRLDQRLPWGTWHCLRGEGDWSKCGMSR